MQIIYPKLYEPKVKSDAIIRNKIVDKIKNENNIIIIAPSGYGKTVLMQQLFSKYISVWYNIDEYDNSINEFFLYLIEGLKLKLSKFNLDASCFLEDEESVDICEIANKFIYEIQNLNYNIVLKLDDYHNITNDDIHFFMYRIMMYIPENLKIIITSRKTPNIPFFKLKNNYPAIITDISLSFNEEEEELYLKDIIKTNNIKSFRKKNLGWPYGLKMLKNSNDRKILKNMDILFENMLDILDDNIKNFVTVTAQLGQNITVSITNYILDIDNADEIYETLITQGFFITRNKSNYGYHALFVEYIRNKYVLDKKCLKKICDFLVYNNSITEAIDVCLFFNEYDIANKIIIEDNFRHITSCYYEEILRWNNKISHKEANEFIALKLIKIKTFILNDIKVDINILKNLSADDSICSNIYYKLFIDITLLTLYIECGSNDKAIEIVEELGNKIYNYDVEYIGDFIEQVVRLTPMCMNKKYLILENINKYYCMIDKDNIEKKEIFILQKIEYLFYIVRNFDKALYINNILETAVGEYFREPSVFFIYFYEGNVDESKTIVENQIKLYTQYGHDKKIPTLQYILAVCELYKGNYKKAYELYKNNTFITDEIEFITKIRMLATYIRILFFYNRKQELESILKSSSEYNNLLNTKWNYIIESSLCEMYFANKEYNKSKNYAENILRNSQNMVQFNIVPRVKIIYACILIYEKSYKKAIEVLENMEEIEVKLVYVDLKYFFYLYNDLINFIKSNEIDTFYYIFQKDVSEKQLNKVDVRFFGENIVTIKNKVIKWRTIKARDIFYYLVYYKEQGVSRDKIISVFWSDIPRSNAMSLLRTNMTYIRKSLNTAGLRNDIIVYQNNRYIVNDSYIEDDILEIKKLIELSRFSDLETRILAIEDIYNLIKKGFCKDVDIEEFINVEQDFKNMCRNIVSNLSKELLKSGKKEKITCIMKSILREFL